MVDWNYKGGETRIQIYVTRWNHSNQSCRTQCSGWITFPNQFQCLLHFNLYLRQLNFYDFDFTAMWVSYSFFSKFYFASSWYLKWSVPWLLLTFCKDLQKMRLITVKTTFQTPLRRNGRLVDARAAASPRLFQAVCCLTLHSVIFLEKCRLEINRATQKRATSCNCQDLRTANPRAGNTNFYAAI